MSRRPAARRAPARHADETQPGRPAVQGAGPAWWAGPRHPESLGRRGGGRRTVKDAEGPCSAQLPRCSPADVHAAPPCAREDPWSWPCLSCAVEASCTQRPASLCSGRCVPSRKQGSPGPVPRSWRCRGKSEDSLGGCGLWWHVFEAEAVLLKELERSLVLLELQG